MNKIKLLTPIFLAVLASCSSKESTDNSGTSTVEFTYEVDTVMVDAGEEFIHVNWNLTTSDLSEDGKYFYNFKTGADKPGLEIIDLENLNLERVIPMELDGPNAIRSPYMSDVYLLSDGTFYLSDSYVLYLFDQEGNKRSELTFANHDFDGDKLPEELRIDLNQAFDEAGNRVVTFYSDQKLEKAPLGIAVFDLENKQFFYKPVPLLSEMEKYRTNYYIDDYPVGAMFSSFYLLTKGDSLIVSNSGSNELYFYNLKTDSVSSKAYSSQYTSFEITKSFPERVDSEAEYRSLIQETRKNVHYGSLIFDGQHDVYWRFSKEMDRMKGDTLVYKNVLTAFDPQFNQLHEELLPEDFEVPYKAFVRKGMIYTFLNIDDEVAFVRYNPSFEK
ncbi:DUF4221 domain-containing protein [Algoriphagus halophytocola]|uniref:DUF4221 domain-containing protein n=1 Tax=Algoriphagus halophytocola TaxID=2991499 RepID=A0ABY6MD42_9BACT|nr:MULTISPECIES: DUF4221 domain-containing protein [unclassified Algoriphagus]UZD21635.1 DUF4221 domain-containing protein [Algoriphagus sp. TR-M5]WBL42847.1 DUF4221 domain-containing protein [Algoriphagus sp. TR-M9]